MPLKNKPQRVYIKCHCGTITYVGKAYKDYAGWCPHCGALVTGGKHDLLDRMGRKVYGSM